MDRVRVEQDVLTRGLRYGFDAMASRHELLVCARDRVLADRAAWAAIADVRRIERKYTRYRDDSVTAAINAAAGGEAVAIDTETASLLRYADRCHRISDGRFDLTSGALRRAWDFRRRPPALPDEATLAQALALVGWSEVEWDERAIRLPRKGMELDFGGIGKEYAVDRAAAILLDHGIASALVNLGGDVRAIGAHPDGSPWRVGIRHPREAQRSIATVGLVDAALATSGDYERYFEVDGRRYCHLLDPRRGWPVAHWQSASVVAPLAVVAGSLATIAMLGGEGAAAFLDAQGAHWLLVAADGSPRTSAGLADAMAPQRSDARPATMR
ncbi:MAG: FAD:protein FMN transferase [Candidatus Levyibacteriota bacterium]